MARGLKCVGVILIIVSALLFRWYNQRRISGGLTPIGNPFAHEVYQLVFDCDWSEKCDDIDECTAVMYYLTAATIPLKQGETRLQRVEKGLSKATNVRDLPAYIKPIRDIMESELKVRRVVFLQN